MNRFLRKLLLTYTISTFFYANKHHTATSISGPRLCRHPHPKCTDNYSDPHQIDPLPKESLILAVLII